MKQGFYTGLPKATTRMMLLCLISSNASALDLNVYGVGHVSADSNDDGNDRQIYIASSSSRLGFSGGHLIMNKLKVIFQFETGVDVTGRGENDGNGPGTNNSIFTKARDSFVGLEGSGGKIIAGRLGILNQWLYDYNLFADQVGDLGNLWGGTGLPGREDGVISYISPNLNGLNAQVTYKPESGSKNEDVSLFKVNYSMGNLKFGAGYINVGKGNAVNVEDHSAMAFTGSYAGNNFTVGGGYQSDSDIDGISGNDRDSYTMGASYSFGKHTIKTQYTKSTADTNDSDADQFAIGWDYSLHKSTTVYIAYSQTDNDTLAGFNTNNYGHGQSVSPFSVGEDPMSVSVGVVYKFDVALIK